MWSGQYVETVMITSYLGFLLIIIKIFMGVLKKKKNNKGIMYKPIKLIYVSVLEMFFFKKKSVMYS